LLKKVRTCEQSPDRIGILFKSNGQTFEDGVAGQGQNRQEVSQATLGPENVRVTATVAAVKQKS